MKIILNKKTVTLTTTTKILLPPLTMPRIQLRATSPPSTPSRGTPCRLRVSLEEDGYAHSDPSAEILPIRKKVPIGCFDDGTHDACGDEDA